MNVRFTAWLSEAERDALDEAARRMHTSANFVLRMTLRAGLGLDDGNQVSRLLHVTSETSTSNGEGE